jgi:hypothetical protein
MSSDFEDVEKWKKQTHILDYFYAFLHTFDDANITLWIRLQVSETNKVLAG